LRLQASGANRFSLLASRHPPIATGFRLQVLLATGFSLLANRFREGTRLCM
jgi:hypothetical protein